MMRPRLFILLVLVCPFLTTGAVPELFLTRTGSLLFAITDLTTNGVPGLSNAVSRATVSGIPSHSTKGGRITTISTQEWVRLYQGANNYDQTFAIAVDASNNVCVSGYTIHPGNDTDFLTLKYGSDGRALWTNLYDGLTHGVDYGRLLATDAEGNVFVSGEDSYNFAGHFDVATIKYSAQGVPVWTNRFNFSGTNQNTPSGLFADAAGNAYVTIYTYGPAEPGYIVLKYRSDGLPVWTNYYKAAPNSSDSAADIAVDEVGNVFVTGGSAAQQVPSGMLTLKYASDGNAIWTNGYSALSVQGREVVLDDQDNILVLGENGVGGVPNSHVYVLVKYSNHGVPFWTNILQGPLYQGGNVPQLVPSFGGSIYVLGGSPDANGTGVDFTITKFSADGAVLWTNRLFEMNVGNRAPGRAAVDHAGNFYLTYSAGVDFTNRDFVVVKYGSEGTAFWTNRFNGPSGSADIPAAAATDNMGSVYITGFTRPASGVWNCATVKFAEYIHYDPPPDFVGTDSFTFVATDAAGARATNTVTLNVRAETLWFNLSRSSFHTTENGGSRLHLDGAGAAGSVVLYASPDLKSWMPLATNAVANDAVEFVIAPVTTNQFYRAAIVFP
jgi:hypothetical protein